MSIERIDKINNTDALKVEASLTRLTNDFLTLLATQLKFDFIWVLETSHDDLTSARFSWFNGKSVVSEKLTVGSDFIQFLNTLDISLGDSRQASASLPKAIVQILPEKLQARLNTSTVLSSFKSDSDTTALIGGEVRSEFVQDSFLIVNICRNYQSNTHNIKSTLSAKNLIDSLDTAIMYCDLQSLGKYALSLKALDPELLKKHLFENRKALDALVTRDHLVYANQACINLFGAQGESKLYRLFICYFKHQLPGFVETLSNVLKSSTRNFRYQFSITNEFGKEIHICMRFKVPLSLEKFSQVSISFDDVTEQVAIENEVKETLLRYQLVVEGAYGAIWDWDIVKGTVHYSSQWISMRGYQEGEIDNRQENWENSIHPDDKEDVINTLNDYFKGHSRVYENEYRIVCKDNSVRWVVDRGVAKRDASGTVIRMAGSEFDITEKHKSEERLRLAASVFENAAESIIILNTQRLIIDTNDAFLDLLGATEQQVESQLLESFSYDDEQLAIYAAIWERLANKGTWQGEVWKKHLSGKRIPTWLTISAIKDNSGFITHYVGLMTDISHVKNTEEAMYQLAHHDSLTGLPNRLLLNKRLQKAIQNGRENSTNFAVMYMDLDNFKYINDGLGHAVGDKLLKEVATKLSGVFGDFGTVARTSGDEFVVVLERQTGEQEIMQLAQQTLKQLNKQIYLSGHTVRTSASIGIAIFPCDGKDSDTLVSNADAAMYRAKAMGRQGFQFYSKELTQIAIERMQLDSDLQRATVSNQLFLLYQPKYNLNTRKLTGFEALVRWQHPELGLIGPDKFIPIAEETGFIEELGAWVIDQACCQADKWRDQGFDFSNIAVNVSCKQLMTGNLKSIIAKSLTKYNLPACSLEVEITESMIMLQPKDSIEQLQQLRELGISLSIDDFGTGYSSLSQLKEMPINNLKIDKSFVHDISSKADDNVITETILAMADRLGLKVIAEGVETEEQKVYLQINKCDEVQGYLFSQPKRPEEITQADLWLER